jgi:hypothetical protein
MATIFSEIIAKEEIVSFKLSEEVIFSEILREKVGLPSKSEEYLKAFNREKENFKKVKEKLSKTHAGEYVALLEGKVIDSDIDIRKLTERIQRHFGGKPVYIGPVGEVKTLKIPSPRLRR